jgi:enoyl-CoA hydratase/carnithine racemase
MNKLDKVAFQVRDSIGIISLNDPPANELALPEFIPVSLFQEWTADESLKGLIITGEGKNFSAGGKLDLIFKATCNPEILKTLIDNGQILLNEIQNLDIPVIAAINRICFGGGLEIALACHIRVASENALLAFPESNHNLMPGMGGTFRLPSFIGVSQSAKMILGGDIVNAMNAKEMGLIDFIAPRDQAFEYAWTLMKKMTDDRQIKVIRSIMKSLKNSSELSRKDAMIEETLMFCSLAMDEAKRHITEEH